MSKWIAQAGVLTSWLPPRTFMYGPEGVGKTTWAAGAADAVFVGNEVGDAHLGMTRLPPVRTWSELVEQLRELATEAHPWKVIVLDTVDSLHRLAERKVCAEAKVESIESVGGGYGRGPTAAAELWRNLLEGPLRAAFERGLHVVMLGHAKVATTKNPDGSDFDCHAPRVADKVGGMIAGWCDVVLFAGMEPRLSKVSAGMKAKVLGFERVIRTERTPQAMAKNRLSLPPKLGMEWSAFIRALPKTAAEEVARYRARLLEHIEAHVAEEEREARRAWVAGASLAALRAALAKVEQAEAAAQEAAEQEQAEGGGE